MFHDWCNKGRGMCYPVCGMVHIKEPLLIIGKSSPCGGSGFRLSLSEWSFTICLTPYNRNKMCASLNKTFPFFPFLSAYLGNSYVYVGREHQVIGKYPRWLVVENQSHTYYESAGILWLIYFELWYCQIFKTGEPAITTHPHPHPPKKKREEKAGVSFLFGQMLM